MTGPGEVSRFLCEELDTAHGGEETAPKFNQEAAPSERRLRPAGRKMAEGAGFKSKCCARF